MGYAPQPDAATSVRIAALREVLGADVDEIAATLVDEDEVAFPGSWARAGFDRGAAISEYLYEIEGGPSWVTRRPYNFFSADEMEPRS